VSPPVRLGVVFPQTEIGADAGGVRAYAEAARDLGFDHLVAYDHVLGADPAGHPGWSGPYTAASMFHEPFVLLGFLAAAVPGLDLATAVLILPQRQTALVAKQAAEVDVLTDGRFRLGVGQGWNEVEYEALGVPFRGRHRRLEEQVALLRRLLAEPVVTFEGREHVVRAAGINPLPVQQPLPIWFGGSTEAALRRAARLADGVFTLRPLPDRDWEGTLERLSDWILEEGREPERFGIEARVDARGGYPDTWADAAERWRGLGATHLSVNTMGDGLQGPDEHVARLREAMAAIGPGAGRAA
jgi:probable F420-dependent oxidoreductase